MQWFSAGINILTLYRRHIEVEVYHLGVKQQFLGHLGVEMFSVFPILYVPLGKARSHAPPKNMNYNKISVNEKFRKFVYNK